MRKRPRSEDIEKQQGQYTNYKVIILIGLQFIACNSHHHVDFITFILLHSHLYQAAPARLAVPSALLPPLMFPEIPAVAENAADREG